MESKEEKMIVMLKKYIDKHYNIDKLQVLNMRVHYIIINRAEQFEVSKELLFKKLKEFFKPDKLIFTEALNQLVYEEFERFKRLNKPQS